MNPNNNGQQGVSAMLAAEHILIDISLISSSPSFTNITEFGIYHQLSIFEQQQFRAAVTQTISTAESPGRQTVKKLSIT